MSKDILADRTIELKGKLRKMAEEEEKKREDERKAASLDIRKINIAGHMISTSNLAIYLDYINEGASADLINYERKRCEFHQVLFQEAGKDRIKDRESKFGNALDKAICSGLLCPTHKRSSDRKGQCPQCMRFIGFKEIKLNLNRLYKEHYHMELV